MSKRTIIIIAGSVIALALVIGLVASGAGRALAAGSHLGFLETNTTDTSETTSETQESGDGRGPAAITQQPITDAVAASLKLTSATLTTSLMAGKTLVQIAQTQNVAIADVNAAYIKAVKTQLAAAVTAGTLTQAQSDAELTETQSEVAQSQYRYLGMGEHGGMGGYDDHGVTTINKQTVTDAVAASLKLTSTVLTTDLTAGKTLAQIAQTQNVAIADVNAAYINSVKTQLAAAVTAGILTQAQSDAELTETQSEVAQSQYRDLVDGDNH